MNEETKAHNNKPKDFFYAVYERFLNTCEFVDCTIDRYYHIGGYSIKMQFAGRALIPYITPAFEHLRIDPIENPSLTIFLWDSESTGIKMIAPPWEKDAFFYQGEIHEYNTERIYTLFQPGEDTLNLLDVSANIGIFWRRDSQHIPYYTIGAPLRSLLHWWMKQQDRHFLHAAAVGTSKGGVLIAGKGGSGKSTTALSCLDSNLLYAGDDYVLISLDPLPFVYSLFNSAKLNVDQVKLFPHLIPLLYNKEPSEEDKSLILLNQHCPEKICVGFPIKAILLPKVTGRRKTGFSRTKPTTALTALAPSTIFQLSRNRVQSFRVLTRLVKEVPAYVLECGTDIKQIPVIIQEVLRK